ncbi:flagellin N-terminal helical domain-containing protein [Castellaniella defragrans]|uniref:Flagellin n=1 Tax=Castellaniella defragrans TaxID=75697 RepID=A0A7W9TSB7_CASDE|nr:flagellin [Castellaniella defragrans]KAB0622512.1 flagellin [Castellaniella defragrans]MBB6084822.1 flagellin [Castellaniella defragrans]
MVSVRTNVSSLQTQDRNRQAGNALGQAIERLSSGLRINSAKDDAAGQSIANRMEAGLRAGAQVMRGINDGISLMQTAEGGLDGINDLLQRAHELAVQSANGTLSDSDRAAINQEFHQIRAEIDRIACGTEIFGRHPLAPDASTQVPVKIGDTPPIFAKFPGSGQPASFTSGIVSTAYIPTGAKNFVLDIDSLGADDDIQLFTRDGKHLAGTPILGAGGDAVWKNNQVVDAASIQGRVLTESNGFLPAAAYDDSLLVQGGPAFDIDGSASGSYNGMNFSYSGDGDRYETDTAFNDGTNGAGGRLERLSIDEVTEDLLILVVGQGAFQATASWDVMPRPETRIQPPYSEPTDIVVGANFGQDVEKVTIEPTPSDSVSLGLSTVELDPIEQAREALAKLSEALGKVDTYRGQYGALTNRFEGAIQNLAQERNATAAAQSRIQDADYAVEVSSMTRARILQQASTAVLAQANQVPRDMLSLISG